MRKDGRRFGFQAWISAQKQVFRVIFPIFRQPWVAKMIKSGKSDSAWSRRFQRHPMSLYLAPKVAQRAQKHVFGVVFPIFRQPWNAKMIKSDKSDSAWSRPFQWHPIWPYKPLNMQNHLWPPSLPLCGMASVLGFGGFYTFEFGAKNIAIAKNPPNGTICSFIPKRVKKC